MNTNYRRVIPRDLFNESKLLKCLGRLILLIHDNQAPQQIAFEHDDEAFIIGLMDDGYLAVSNIEFKINNVYVVLKCAYNSKSNYNLFCEYDYCDYLVFDDNGNFETEFIEFIETLN